MPGRLNSTYKIRLEGAGAEIDVALGLACSEVEDEKLAPITLCSGNIPIERPSGLNWSGSSSLANKEFSFQGMHIILNSYDFNTNIGRNVVERDAVMAELLPKLFEKVILNRFAVNIARILKDGELVHFYHYKQVMVKFMTDVCIHQQYGYQIPDEVLDAPYIPSLNRFKPYSLRELDDSSGKIYHSWERASSYSMHNHKQDGQESYFSLTLADLPYGFRDFLEQRYGARLLRKEGTLMVEPGSEMVDLTRKVLLHINNDGNQRGFFDVLSHQQAGSNRVDMLAVARIQRFDGSPESDASTAKIRNGLYLNYNSSHIQNLIEMLLDDEGEHRTIAAHFLVRELLFEPGLKLATSMREQLLVSDAQRRFSIGSMDDDQEVGALLGELSMMFQMLNGETDTLEL